MQIQVVNSVNNKINDIYTKGENINQKSHWENTKHLENNNVLVYGFHIYLANSETHEWYISDGRNVLYKACSETFYPPHTGWKAKLNTPDNETYIETNLEINYIV